MSIILPEFSGNVKVFTAGQCLSVPVWGAPRPLASDKKIQWIQMTLENAMVRTDAPAQALADLAAMAADKGKTKRVRVWDNEQRVAVKRDLTYKDYKKACARGDEGARLWGFQFAHTADARSYADVRKRGGAVTPFYIGDVDNIPAESLDSTRKALMGMPCAFAVGTSVSCRGLAVAVAVQHSETAEFTNAYFGRVFDAVQAEINRALESAGLSELENVCLDAAAKNGVRWRYELHDVIFKPAETVLTPIQIDAAAEEKAEAKAEEKAEAKTDASKLEKDARAIAFSLFERGVDLSTAETLLSALYREKRPDSSRLKPGEMRRFVDDAHAYWKANGRGKKACEREKLALMLDGWHFDAFTGRFIAADGRSLDTDTAAAEIARAATVSMAAACDALAAYVQNDPARVRDSLRDSADMFADAYTDADADAIQEYASECGWDAYEARRLQLWLCQMMARAYIPGEKCDCMLVLTGGQGTGKTSFFDEISKAFIGVPASAYAPGEGKDAQIRLAENAIVVLDEFDRWSRKGDVAEIKNALTAASSKVRAAYARGEKTRLNRAVWGATTNAPSPLPPGEAEARRFWLIRVKKKLFCTPDVIRAMLRQAAHEVREGLRMRAAAGLPWGDVRGKAWVETAPEESETQERNGWRKGDSSETLAICAMIYAIGNRGGRVVLSPAQWGYIAETGEAFRYIDGAPSFKPPRCNAAAAARIIAERCKAAGATRQRGAAEDDGRRTNGYRLEQLAAAFSEAVERDEERDLYFC